MEALIPVLLGLVQHLVPAIGTATTIGKVISTIAQVAPVAIKEVQDVTPIIKNIISALSTNPATTAEQLRQLKELSAKVDAEFEAAAEAALAEDAAAAKPGVV